MFLNLFQIHLPVSALVSILHRISGVALVLLIPAAIYSLGLSLQGEEQFATVQAWFGSVFGQIMLLFLLAVFIQHLFSGLRHLAMDIDWGVDVRTARFSARATLFATAVVLAIFVLRWLT